MKKVLIPQDISQEAKDYLIDKGYDVQVGPGFDIETLKAEVKDADALIVRTAEYPKEVIEAGEKLQIIARHGVGVDNIDLDQAKKQNIWVTVAKGANATSVAEHTITLILAAAKRVIESDLACRQDRFVTRNQIGGIELRGKTLGVLGLGAIGQKVAEIANKGLGMRIIASDIVKPQNCDFDFDWSDSLDEVLKQADVLTIHTPLTDETRNLINKESLKNMKDGVIIINCARGGIVNEDDLYDALKSGKVYSAGLDVFGLEPPSKDNKLFELNNVILTPHIAALTKEAGVAMAMSCALAVDDVLSDRKPKFPIVVPE